MYKPLISHFCPRGLMSHSKRLSILDRRQPFGIQHCRYNKILYITDLEGDYEYWQRFLEFNSILKKNHKNNQLELADGYNFVFGGDVCDRGPGDLRILNELVHLKERLPDRVHFILGNRDINKLRLPFTLHPGVTKFIPKCYWLRSPSFTEQAQREVVLHNATSKLEWVMFVCFDRLEIFELF